MTDTFEDSVERTPHFESNSNREVRVQRRSRRRRMPNEFAFSLCMQRSKEDSLSQQALAKIKLMAMIQFEDLKPFALNQMRARNCMFRFTDSFPTKNEFLEKYPENDPRENSRSIYKKVYFPHNNTLSFFLQTFQNQIQKFRLKQIFKKFLKINYIFSPSFQIYFNHYWNDIVSIVNENKNNFQEPANNQIEILPHGNQVREQQLPGQSIQTSTRQTEYQQLQKMIKKDPTRLAHEMASYIYHILQKRSLSINEWAE